MAQIKVLIADDHALVRMGVRLLIASQKDLTLVAEVKNGKEAVAAVEHLRPDVAVLDLLMPQMDGIEATARIRETSPETQVVILTSFGTSDGLSQALANGAIGAVLKSETENELVLAIRHAAAGKSHVTEEIRAQLAAEPPLPPLSPRQLDVLQSITRGLSNPDIAQALGIDMATVKTHIAKIFEKLGVANRSEAVAVALRKQLVKI